MIFSGVCCFSSFFPLTLGVNVIVLIMIPVVFVIFLFKEWYMAGDIGNQSFLINIKVFLAGMLVFLIGYSFLLLFGWELIGIMSFVLISWWWRFDALSGSIAAVMYNRFGDIALIIWIVFVCLSWSLLVMFVMAILGNSSQSLQSYWLPIAIEGPTPVSSLLHSSTIVVAGVFFSSLISWNWILGILGFSSLIFISLLSLSFYDINNIVAFSTSCHLSLIMSYIIVIPSVLLLHIITHGFVNSPVFILSGIWIHFVGSQDLRLFSVMLGYHVNMFMLIGFGVGFIVNSKEFLLFGSDIFLLVLLLYVVVSLRYSSTLVNQGIYALVGSYSLLIIIVLFLIIALTGIMSLCLLDSGINWLVLCFLIILLPFIGDINSVRHVHKY